MTEWLQEVVFWIDQASTVIMAMLLAGMAGVGITIGLVIMRVL